MTINRPSGINQPLTKSRKTPHKTDIFTTITLGNEVINIAAEQEIQHTLQQLQSIYESNPTYNTILNQGQITHAIIQVIKHNYISLLAKKHTGETIYASEIKRNIALINEYELQQRTYRNLKPQHPTIE